MEPVTLIAAAVAIGASEGARETTKQAIGDAYATLKNWIASKYGSVTSEVEGLEREPDEELRRALLEKKLTQIGAGDDPQLYALAQGLLSAVDEQAPDVPATVGVSLRRTSVGGDIEVADISVDGGSGVVVEDVAAGGSLRIQGVSARGAQEPPHPPLAREH